MASRLAITTTEIERGLTELKLTFDAATYEALAEAGNALMNDSILYRPAAPVDIPGLNKGSSFRELEGSGTVIVNRELKHQSRHGNGMYQATTDDGESKGRRAIVVFNAPYAAKWHEHRPTGGYALAHGIATATGYTYGLAGLGFLRRHLYTDAVKYIGIIATRLRRDLKTRKAIHP